MTARQGVLAIFWKSRFKIWKLGKFTIKADGREKGWGDKWEIMAQFLALGLIEMSRLRWRQKRCDVRSGGSA